MIKKGKLIVSAGHKIKSRNFVFAAKLINRVVNDRARKMEELKDAATR
jgi:hypothetical protein